MVLKKLLSTAAALLLAGSAFAQIHRRFAAHRASLGACDPKGAPVGGGYLTITNKGSEPDRFTGGSVDFAKKLELHQMSMDKGVMKMRPVDGGIEIKPGETVTLKPGGLHIMFVGLDKPLEAGRARSGNARFRQIREGESRFRSRGYGSHA